jgi:PAS domain-containing protein
MNVPERIYAEKKTLPSVRWSVLLFASYALIGGGVTLIGWFTGLPRLTDWADSGISMFPNAAFAAVCSGLALVLAGSSPRWLRRVSGLLGLSVATLGSATLFEHFSGIDLGIDRLLITPAWGNKAAMAIGRMGLPASSSYTVLGIGFVLLSSARARIRRIAPLLGIGVSTIAALSLMGYVLGADPLFAVARYTGIALQTATVLLALALGVLASAPECEPLRTLQQASAAGVLVRRSLPFIVLLPIVLGWMRVRGQLAGFYDTAMGTSLLALVTIAILCGLLWWWSRALAKYESAFRQSQAAEATRRTELETEVLERKRAQDKIADQTKALRSAHARLHGIISSAMDAVITIDSQQQIILFNPAAETMFGLSAGAANGQDIQCLIPERFRGSHGRFVRLRSHGREQPENGRARCNQRSARQWRGIPH